jgi:peptidoglycan/xylan/chitin deacetylase (PgdA/CDA1 family)
MSHRYRSWWRKAAMTPASFVISLDFEQFWGVVDTRSVAGYGRNVLGEWQAIPRLLALFRRHGLRVTWATVGMLMCRDYQHWRAIRPSILPGYACQQLSPYTRDKLVQENPQLFFGRSLVQQIMATEGQELATHTYSHFYCGQAGATPMQLAADLACARNLAAELGVALRSAVLPRNQVLPEYLPALADAGVRVYRGNPDHWLYRRGDKVAGGGAGRIARFADACLPLSGAATVAPLNQGRLVNLPASLFLYPWSSSQRALAWPRLARIKRAMTAAARSGGVFHLWWHPHNFGVNLEQNLGLLGELLLHYRYLADTHGMRSRCMGDFAALAGAVQGQGVAVPGLAEAAPTGP